MNSKNKSKIHVGQIRMFGGGKYIILARLHGTKSIYKILFKYRDKSPEEILFWDAEYIMCDRIIDKWQ